MSLSEIQRRFTVAEQTVALPGFPVTLLKPRNPDDLISEADFVKDERLPYWADLWAAAEVLATYVLSHGAVWREGRSAARAIEFGCGLGLVAIAAQRAGFATLATDYYDDALLFAAHNAERALGAPVATQMVDWTAMPTDLGRFDLVLAADVLYEMRYAPILADAVAQTLAPDGLCVLADQGRIGLHAFLQETSARGLRHAVRLRQEPPPEVQRPTISVYELRWGTG